MNTGKHRNAWIRQDQHITENNDDTFILLATMLNPSCPSFHCILLLFDDLSNDPSMGQSSCTCNKVIAYPHYYILCLTQNDS